MASAIRHLRSAPAPSQVKADKQREVRDGHDGTWVAHPALVGVALDIFNAGMRTPNQVQSQSEASAKTEGLHRASLHPLLVGLPKLLWAA